MVDLTFDEILEAAIKLPPQQKKQLAKAIRPHSLRDEIIEETRMLREAGAFEHIESLYGRYAGSGNRISEQELDDHLRSVGRAWEDELDEFS